MIFSSIKTRKLDHQVRTVVVMGSKPNPIFPLIDAEVVVTAKSSVEQGLVYRNKFGSKIIALVPWPELEERDYMQPALIKSQPEELIVLGDNNGDSIPFIENVLKIDGMKVMLHTYRERNFNLLKNLGMYKFLLMFHMLRIRGIKFMLTTAIQDMLSKRNMQWLSRSTGINAILYAIERFPNAKIIVVGIGLVSGEHFDGKGTFTNKSAKSDQIFMKYWPRKKRLNVYTTDDKLHEMGNVSLWKGKTFV